jgi:hypothetical protein
MRSRGALCNRIVLALIGLGWVSIGQGQVVMDQASTVGESYARGLGDVISSAGQYNLNTSQAAINMTQAQHQEILNRQQWTSAYFDMREVNRAARAKERGPAPTEEQLVRFAQMGCPKPLATAQLNFSDGRITWPDALTQEQFSENRKTLDAIFAKRAERGGIGFEDRMEARSATTAMLESLKRQVRQMPAAMYITAKDFLQSLAYEAMKAT